MAINGKLTFATDSKGNYYWRVKQLRPDVAIVFKRLFTQIRKGEDEHILSDSDEVRADLEWFCQRYPLETKQKPRLARGAQRIAKREKARAVMLSEKWTPPPLAGFKEPYAPYLYQAQAAALCLDNGALLLGDDVGLGKTISTFALAVGGAPLPMAIVVEPHLVRQWTRQITKFTHLRAHAVKQSTPYRLPVSDVVVFSYNMLAGWVDVFSRGLFKSVAYDEIQQLRKGTEAAKGRAAAVLSGRAEVKLGLSATPIFNYGDEIFTVMSYLHDGLLGSREEFMREWCGWKGAVQDPDALGSYLERSGYMLRRREDDAIVDQSLPPAHTLEYLIDADDTAIKDEEELLKRIADTVLTGSFTERGQAARQLDVRMRHLTGVSKAKSVALYVKMLLREKQKVLLAGWHRDVYEIWGKSLSDYNPVMYTGSESKAGKDRSVQSFVNSDSRVMMISLRSGSGLDGLQQACSDVVFGELDWSPQVHYQMRGRLRRPGQLLPVTGHYLHTNMGSDPLVMQTLGVKSDQARGIMDPGSMPEARLADDSRIKKLAQAVLDR